MQPFGGRATVVTTMTETADMMVVTVRVPTTSAGDLAVTAFGRLVRVVGPGDFRREVVTTPENAKSCEPEGLQDLTQRASHDVAAESSGDSAGPGPAIAAKRPGFRGYLPTFVMGAFRTIWASFSVTFFDFANDLIWSSFTSRTGVTPGFQVTKNSSQSGL